MKNIISLIIIFILVSCSIERENDLKLMNINGHVKNITEQTFNAKDSLLNTKYSKFNNKGLLTSVTIDLINFKTRTLNYYNSKGLLKSMEIYVYDTLALKNIYKRNADIYDSIIMYNNQGKVVGYGLLKHNKKGNVVKSILYDTNMEILNTEQSIYDHYDRLIEFTTSGIEKSAVIYHYDSLSRIDKCITTENGEIVSEENYKYTIDNKRNWILKEVSDSNDILIKTVKRKLEYK